MADEKYTRLNDPSAPMDACPCCGARPELWQFVTEIGGAQKVVMCANGDPIGPQDGIADGGCLLYMPPNGFYRATIREAVNYWNGYAKALIQLRDTQPQAQEGK